MNKSTFMMVLVVATACAPANEDNPPSAESSAASPVAAKATVAREIYIDSVRVGDSVLVFGRARTFENTVQVRVRDDSGRVVADTFTTSVGEMGHQNPFVATVRLPRNPGARVRVEAFEYSANDGSVRSLVDTVIPYVRPG